MLVFEKCINYISKTDFSRAYFEFIKSYERKTNVMTRSRISVFCERYNEDIGINDVKSKRILHRSVNQKLYVYTIIKIIILCFRTKIGKKFYLMG